MNNIMTTAISNFKNDMTSVRTMTMFYSAINRYLETCFMQGMYKGTFSVRGTDISLSIDDDTIVIEYSSVNGTSSMVMRAANVIDIKLSSTEIENLLTQTNSDNQVFIRDVFEHLIELFRTYFREVL